MIINKYLFREVLFTLLAVTLVLMLIFLSGRFLRFLMDVAAGALPMSEVLGLVLLKSTASLAIVVPLALYIAVLLGLSRLYKDNEMTALAACGVGVDRVMKTVGVFALVVAVPVALLSLWIAPWAEAASRGMIERAQATVDIEAFGAGRFHEVRGSDAVFYVERVEPGSRMGRVFVMARVDGREDMVVAERAYQQADPATGERVLVLENGYRYEGAPGSADYRMLEFQRHTVRLREPEVEVAHRRLRELPTTALLGSQDREERAELQWRLAAPVSAVLMALLAVLLSRTSPRQGRYGKLFVAILVYVIYNNLLNVARTWLERGVVPEVVGMWWVHGALALIVAVALARELGYLRGARAARAAA
ncbi:LPS export ABC transporter permease LptF [Ectothiorhodospiraceae bacterium 2226]|nr:LPS export ABC transporter permease LptF [Ectothiorhodospiraceae bacterium 2226]